MPPNAVRKIAVYRRVTVAEARDDVKLEHNPIASVIKALNSVKPSNHCNCSFFSCMPPFQFTVLNLVPFKRHRPIIVASDWRCV